MLELIDFHYMQENPTPPPVGHLSARDVPGTNGEYILTKEGELYRVRSYALHTALHGWQKRTKSNQLQPRRCGKRTVRYCLYYQGKRRDVALSTLKREVFG